MTAETSLKRIVKRWRIIRNIGLTVFLIVAILFLPISWSKSYHEVGVDAPHLGAKVTEVVETHYSLSWERQELIRSSDPRIKNYERGMTKNAILSMQLVSLREAYDEPQVYINVEQLEPDADQFDFNLAGLLAARLDLPRKVHMLGKAIGLFRSNTNTIDCGCVEKVDDVYPVCSSVFIYKPYLIEVTVYRPSSRCIGRDSYQVPDTDINKFNEMSQKIESALQAELLHPS